MKNTVKIPLKIALGVCVMGIIAFGLFYPGKGGALEELDKGVRENHPDPFTKVTEAEFDDAVSKLEQSWKELGEVEDGRYYAMRRLVASLGDEHTSLAPSSRTSQPQLPFFVLSMEGSWIVVQAQKEYSGIVGKRLTAINDVTVDELRSLLLPLISHETDGWGEYQCSLEMRYLRNLRYIGVSDTLESVDITVEDCRTKEVETLTVEACKLGYNNTNSSMYAAIAPTLVQSGYYRAEAIEDGVLFIQYNVCAQAPDLSMEDFAQTLREQTSAAPPEKILIDMRHNTGGDSNVITPLLALLGEYAEKGSELYCLTGSETFSSGVMNVLDLKEIGACIVGESTGGVMGFGELKTIRLSDGSRLYCSTKDFSQHYGFHDAVDPDVPVVQTVEDFLAGTDSVVSYILENKTSFSSN